jgi:DNA mismatch endonuclease (patch repair protein)
MANLTEGWDRARAEDLVHDEVLPAGSWASSTEVRASMRGNRGRDTAPELRLRSLLYARGLRYRVSTRPVPSLRRTADVVFPGARVAVFVDGCYWHRCPEHHRPATKNSQFWRTKIADNQRRDAETNRVLENEGWTVVRCWEHEDPVDVADRIVNVLKQKLEQRR